MGLIHGYSTVMGETLDQGCGLIEKPHVLVQEARSSVWRLLCGDAFLSASRVSVDSHSVGLTGHLPLDYEYIFNTTFA